ncbi:MAG TPA: hypothetical protein VGX25_33015 [Actinophytocola sp.]|uniref:hypothetical protein n=1 Tax=Actinophytocola sp. TaxID=1872138 RepID=UPI002DDCB01F|nr:hypothetical protein [Actinophytocola sp.]HEV2784233.1 hypothetical protein [Actinophytocola sp.]
MSDAVADGGPRRHYLIGRLERLRRHLRVHFTRAFLGGISSSAIVAGFLDATGVSWSLIAYISLAAGVTAAILTGQGLSSPRTRYLLLSLGRPMPGAPDGGPAHGSLVAASRSAPVRQIEAARCPDPVYAGGLRMLCGSSHPLIVVPSNRRDVGKAHELLFPLFTAGQRHSRVQVDLLAAGIPLKPYEFERELPDGAQDPEHTLAIKDLVYVPELADALRRAGARIRSPLLWPEHCVDPALLAARDLVIVGGADTNFWHATLFEPVVREFERPKSSVPLAMDLRDATGQLPAYGSRVLTARLAGLSALFPHTRGDEAEFDERVFPTYGMVLACRNPFAAAVDRSHWCVFIAGTRSLGTSGGVLALAAMLNAMHADPERNFFSLAPTAAPDVRARVSAVLYRTREVEQAVLRRSGRLLPRTRRLLEPEGLDLNYSDSYMPTAVEYLGYETGVPEWRTLGRIPDAECECADCR